VIQLLYRQFVIRIQPVHGGFDWFAYSMAASPVSVTFNYNGAAKNPPFGTQQQAERAAQYVIDQWIRPVGTAS